MDTDAIGAALKRKLGPLPVWIWAILGGAVVYWLRKRGYFQGVLGSTESGTALQPQQSPAGTPQAQVPLQPGESVYDPNTGTISTAPGGDFTGNPEGTGTSSGVDPAQAIDDLANAISEGHTTGTRTHSAAPKKTHKSLTRHAKKPAHHGKRTPGKKAAHKGANHHKATTKPHNPAHKERSRSKAAVRPHNGGRTKSHKGGTQRSFGPGHGTAPASHKGTAKPRAATVAKPAPRARPTVGLTRKTAALQHPVSANSRRPSAAKHAAPAPRPSAPAPRSVRTPPPRPAPAPPPRRTAKKPARRSR